MVEKFDDIQRSVYTKNFIDRALLTEIMIKNK